MDNLIIYQRVYDFTLWLFPIVDRFPKHEKFVLCSHIKGCVLDIAREIIRANKSRNKKPLLYDIDVKLEELKMLMRHWDSLCKEAKWLTKQNSLSK